MRVVQIKKRSIRILPWLVSALLVTLFSTAFAGNPFEELQKQIPGQKDGMNPWTWNRPFIPGHVVILEPVKPIRIGEPTDFRLAIFQRFDSGALKIEISKLSRIEYHGAMSWATTAEIGDTLFYYLSVIISPNDTAGMEVTVTNAKGRAEAHLYVISTVDPPNFWFLDPRLTHAYLLQHEPRQKFRHPVDDTLPEYTDSVLFHDEKGNIIKGDSALKILKQLQQAMDPNMVWHQTSPGVVFVGQSGRNPLFLIFP